MNARWLLYVLGGGLGHFQRGFALARAAARDNIHTTLLTNSLYLEQLIPHLEIWRPKQVELCCLPGNVTADESAAFVQSQLRRASVLVVDTFPRGLGGELALLLDSFAGCKVWIHRDISPNYLQQFAIRDQWAPRYDCILAPGERGELADLACETPPWLILDHQEVATREAARDAWQLPPDGRVVLVVGSGKPAEVDAFAKIAAHLQESLPETSVRFAGFNGRQAKWPLLKTLRAADVLVGAGGYNTVHEAKALQIPLIGIPQLRMYDRQSRRLQQHAFSMVPPGPQLEQRVVLAVERAFACCGRGATAVPLNKAGTYAEKAAEKAAERHAGKGAAEIACRTIASAAEQSR